VFPPRNSRPHFRLCSPSTQWTSSTRRTVSVCKWHMDTSSNKSYCKSEIGDGGGRAHEPTISEMGIDLASKPVLPRSTPRLQRRVGVPHLHHAPLVHPGDRRHHASGQPPEAAPLVPARETMMSGTETDTCARVVHDSRGRTEPGVASRGSIVAFRVFWEVAIRAEFKPALTCSRAVDDRIQTLPWRRTDTSIKWDVSQGPTT
jgi:hypothetical protein